MAIVGGYDDIAIPVQAAVYRIAQEAITNARRHATNATVVQVALDVSDDVIDLRISDDGTSAKEDSRRAGHGLTGMAERVALLSGAFHAGPGPHGGWTVAATIPRHREMTS